MYRVLIVFDELPEDWNFLDLMVSDVELELYKKWHNHYMNADKNEFNDEMNDHFYTDDGKFKFESNRSKTIPSGKFDAVVMIGFIL